MKNILLISFLLLISPAFADDFYNVKYLSNYDGDTIRFDLEEPYKPIFRYTPLRLYGIDTPEMRTTDPKEKKAAIKAKKFVEKRLKKAKEINLLDCKKDKYFRINCRVQYDGKDLTKELLKRGYGYEYYGGKKRTETIKENLCR